MAKVHAVPLPPLGEARRSAPASVRRIIELVILFYQFLVVYKRLIPGMKAAAAAFATAAPPPFSIHNS
jgi:hypothetical protein